MSDSRDHDGRSGATLPPSPSPLDDNASRLSSESSSSAAAPTARSSCPPSPTNHRNTNTDTADSLLAVEKSMCSSDSSNHMSSSSTSNSNLTDARGILTPTESSGDASVCKEDAERRRRLALYGDRALAAGGKRRGSLLTHNHTATAESALHTAPRCTESDMLTSASTTSHVAAAASSHSGRLAHGLCVPGSRYLVVGDGLMAPFMALCLRVHGLDCDLAHYPSNSDLDRGTITLTPSVTQLMGDVLNVSVPSGSVVGRILTFDHVGNDMCDMDLNEFREKGESPTFFCCDRLKVESALLSLCHLGTHRCHVLSKPVIDRGGLEALGNGGVRVRFASGMHQDYLGVICTARSPELVPELTLTNAELQQRSENAEKYKQTLAHAVRWLEVCVPPLPELRRYEKRFTPGSQEIVEILTPRDAKLTVRPTMMATKLFYNVVLTIPDGTPDPRLRSTSTKQFWDDVVMHWTSGIPGYISHTMFRPMFTHMQQNLTRTSALVYRSPLFLMPHWSEGGGRVIKVAHAAHGSCFDAIDISDAQGFADCFGLARAIAGGEDVGYYLKERRLQVMEELDHHARLVQYGIKERGQMAYMASRFNMKILRKYKKSWRSILQNYVTLMPKTATRHG